MNAAEKAKELVDKYQVETNAFTGNVESHSKTHSKKCALIAVDEILLMFKGLHKPEYVSFDIYEPKQYHNEEGTDFNGYTMSEYWEQVKLEINEL